jgi:DinB superfamily
MYQTTELLNNLYHQVEKHLDLTVREWQNLPPSVFSAKTDAQSWSAAQCLEHLNIYGRHYLPEMEKAIEKAERKGFLPTPQYKSGWLGDYFFNVMLPKNTGELATKMNAPKNAYPIADLDAVAVIAEFIEQQERLLKLIERARQINMGSVRVPISLSRWIRLRLGDTFLFLIAHQYRHILQAERALGKQPTLKWWKND